MSVLQSIITEIWTFLLVVSPYLLLGLFIAGIIHAFIGENFIRNHLGSSGFLSILKATLFGIPLPVCSCSVIPIAAGLRKDGASKSATLSFLVSTPTTGVDSFFVTYAFLGMGFALARPLAALVAGILIGLLIYFFENEPSVKLTKVDKKPEQQSYFIKVRSIFQYAFGVLPQDLSSTLLTGIAVGGILSAVIPVDFASPYLSNPWIAYPLMLGISVPLYICAVGSVPIAAALLAKDLVPGAALAFLIAGTATNTITMSFVVKKLGHKTFTLYILSIVTIAVIFGLGLDFFTESNFSLPHSHHHDNNSHWIQIISTIILLSIFAYHIIPFKKRKIKDMDYSFNVPDMSCMHCKMKIENALSSLEGIEKINIDLDGKIVNISGDINQEVVIKTINNTGYSASVK